jgi:hypothetical protein
LVMKLFHSKVIVLFCLDTKKNQKKSRLFSFLNAKTDLKS